MKPRPQSQSGYALFLILIAVALFAALSYSVAEMMRSGNPNTIQEEKANVLADEILAYARTLRGVVQRLKISNNCTDTAISFESPDVAGYEHSPVTTDACKIFHESGGGMNYMVPVDNWLDMNYSPAPALRGAWYFPRNTCAAGTGTAPTNCASDSVDNEALIAILPYMRKAVCVQLNDALGIANPGGNPPADTGNAWPTGNPKHIGVFADGESIDQSGHMAGCFEGVSGQTPANKTYHFYMVLLPR